MPSDPKTVLFGALAPSLREQGWDDDGGLLQQDADAISRLYVRNLISQSVVEKAHRKIVKRLRPLPVVETVEGEVSNG